MGIKQQIPSTVDWGTRISFGWLWSLDSEIRTKLFLIKINGNLNYGIIKVILSKSEWVKFSLIESVIFSFTIRSVKMILFTLKSVNFHWFTSKKYFSRLNQLIFTEVISEILLVLSNLFLAIWINQISLINSRFLLIQI